MTDRGVTLPVVVVVGPPLDDSVRASLGGLLVGLAELRTAPVLPRGRGIVGVVVGPETPFEADAMASLPDLRVVAASSAGTDHLAVDAVVSGGAVVTRVADYCTEEVADHALALVLALLRGLGPGDRSVRAGHWGPIQPEPRRVAGTRLGLVGYGRTARALAVRASALGMTVCAYARDPATVDGAGVQVHSQLETLLAGSDVVSLHVPLTPGTRRLIDAPALSMMRPGAFLVNVARGGLLDQRAVHAALDSGRLAGVALDVVDPEPPPSGEPLNGRDDVLVTPHVAWCSADARRELYLRAVGSVAAVLRGDPARVPAGLDEVVR